jgi:hypothetical protein
MTALERTKRARSDACDGSNPWRTRNPRVNSTGKPVPLLVLRVDPDDREALLSIGHPLFASRAGRDRIGALLTDVTDWEEIRELVTEGYRVLAPKKLTALLD